MSKGDFIALINPAITFIIATALFILWNFRRDHRYVAVLGTAFLCLSGGFLLEYIGFSLQSVLAPPRLSFLRLTANALLLTGACLLVYGTLARYRIRIPFVGMLCISTIGLSSYAWFLLAQPDMTVRIFIMNYAGGALVFLLVSKLYALTGKKPVDHALVAVFLLWGLDFFVRTTAVVWYEGPYGLGGGDFFNTLYWITLTLSFACFLLVLAVILTAAVAMDVIEKLKAESCTDLLTGLSNRRGFEDHLAGAVAEARQKGLPLALVLADLDSFKSVNDTYGHAVGDEAIAAFAASLRDHLTSQQAARIGGEEFAVLLPASEINAARLFAESVRVAFSAAPVEGLPSAERLTASFGVAELQPQEDGAGLMRRADAALYRAKHDGRDRVVLAESSLLLFRASRQARPEPLSRPVESGVAN